MISVVCFLLGGIGTGAPEWSPVRKVLSDAIATKQVPGLVAMVRYQAFPVPEDLRWH